MTVAKEFPNSKSTLNIGVEALYLIATLPDEQKQEQLAKAEQGESLTVRELQELQLGRKFLPSSKLSVIISEK